MQSFNNLELVPVHQPLAYLTLTPTHSQDSNSLEEEGVILQLTEGSIQSCNVTAERIVKFAIESVCARETQQRDRELAEVLPHLVWMADLQGNIHYWNQRWYDYTGLSEAESMGLASYDALHPDEIDRTLEGWHQSVATGEIFESECRVRHRDGGYRWFMSRGVPTRDSQEEITGWIGTLTDIDDLKQKQEALQQSEAFKERMLESSRDCIKVLDMEGKLLYMNPGGQRLMEIDDFQPFLNLDWLSCWESADREVVELAIATAKAGNYGSFQGFCPTAKGQPKWWEVFITPIHDGTGHVVQLLSVSRDISARKQAEQALQENEAQLRQQTEQLTQANRVKDEFLAILSHELRTPLNPILGWARLLQRGNLNPEKMQQAVVAIERNAKLQMQLIDDLLDISRIIRGKLTLKLEPLSLVHPILAAIETVHQAAAAKSIALETDFQSLHQEIAGDSGRLQQVLWNLLSNAIKFTPEGGRVTVRLEQIENFACIQVSDTGKGISADFLPHIFEMFRQQDNSITRQFGGLGLGLTIGRQLVEAHGGTISVASAGEGQGSTFTVQLPLRSMSLGIRPSVSLVKPLLNLQGIHVLVVDDEPDALEFMRVVLEQEGAIVTTVPSAHVALKVLTRSTVDVLVSDLQMPQMDGYSFLSQVRALSHLKHLPAIALTAYAYDTDRERSLRAGYQRHLAKPIDFTVLIHAIGDLCPKSPSLRRLK